MNIHIITLHSLEGGSTESLIGLTNMFNQRNVNATMHGPHQYHLNKCNGKILANNIQFNRNDIFIGHLIELQRRPNSRKVILSCHEKHAFPLQEKNISGYDVVRFVSQHQKEWHKFSGSSVITPPNLPHILPVDKSPDTEGAAGIIGTIFPPKKTHLSIKRALGDGMRKVLLFGNIGDRNYYNLHVKPLLSSQVIYKGHLNNLQEIYDSISCVYQSSESETYGRVKAECKLAGIAYHGTPECDIDIDILSDNELFDAWMELFQ